MQTTLATVYLLRRGSIYISTTEDMSQGFLVSSIHLSGMTCTVCARHDFVF